MIRDLGVILQQQGVEVKAKGSGDGVDSPSLEIKLDATGRAIAMRRSAGRIRHIATPMLWLHLLVINGDFKMTRVGGNDNCADLVSSRKSSLAHLHSSSLSQPFFS